MNIAQLRCKARKHKPKKKSVCVGQFVSALYRDLAKTIMASDRSPEIQAAQFQVMHMTDLQICLSWCGCPTCKKHAENLLKFIQPTEVSDEPNESTQQEQQDEQ